MVQILGGSSRAAQQQYCSGYGVTKLGVHGLSFYPAPIKLGRS